MTGFCEIWQIAEVLADVKLQQQRSVRITGRLDAYDAGKALARVSFQGAAMTVETQIMATTNFELQIGSMYQFLGETYQVPSQNGRPEVRLVARVGRNVDTLDIDLFLQALDMRRQFLASR